VVYLKNGSIIKGQIIEQIPGSTIKLQTKDGSVFVYKVDEIEKMTREQAK
jgi:sRNA-binding regulator protein Hfq